MKLIFQWLLSQSKKVKVLTRTYSVLQCLSFSSFRFSQLAYFAELSGLPAFIKKVRQALTFNICICTSLCLNIFSFRFLNGLFFLVFAQIPSLLWDYVLITLVNISTLLVPIICILFKSSQFSFCSKHSSTSHSCYFACVSLLCFLYLTSFLTYWVLAP